MVWIDPVAPPPKILLLLDSVDMTFVFKRIQPTPSAMAYSYKQPKVHGKLSFGACVVR